MRNFDFDITDFFDIIVVALAIIGTTAAAAGCILLVYYVGATIQGGAI